MEMCQTNYTLLHEICSFLVFIASDWKLFLLAVLTILFILSFRFPAITDFFNNVIDKILNRKRDNPQPTTHNPKEIVKQIQEDIKDLTHIISELKALRKEMSSINENHNNNYKELIELKVKLEVLFDQLKSYEGKIEKIEDNLNYIKYILEKIIEGG